MSFDKRINAWLQENAGEQFTRNKWRFWYLTLCGFQLLNATLTALVFSAGGQLENAMGAVVLAVGGLLAWLGVAFMHYSDSADRQLAYRVSVLDSITLICVLAHFSFLAWTFGHLKTIQSAESKYDAAAIAYNAKAEKVSTDNVEIAKAAQNIAVENRKRARLENDTTYQQRRIIEAGGVPRASAIKGQIGDGPALSTSAVELEKPTKPAEGSAEFLSRWDGGIRLANLAELILAAVTLIYIRVRSSKTNAPVEIASPMGDKFSTGVYRSPISTPAFRTTKKETPKKHASFRFDNPEGLKILREVLRDISFRLAGRSFKSYVRGDAVWILLMRANQGTQETENSAKATLEILDDALSMEREQFRLRLERFLIQNGFEI